MADKKKAAPQEKSSMTTTELASELRSALAQRAKLEFSHKVAPLKDPMELRRARREIARLKTHLRLKEAAK